MTSCPRWWKHSGSAPSSRTAWRASIRGGVLLVAWLGDRPVSDVYLLREPADVPRSAGTFPVFRSCIT